MNLSDLAAMGADPLCLAAFGPPKFTDGACRRAGPVAGGDFSRAPVLTLSVTDGRRASAGASGGSRPGTAGRRLGAASRLHAAVIPRLAEGLERDRRAMIDVSDGTATCGGWRRRRAGEVWLDRLPVAPGATIEQAAAAAEGLPDRKPSLRARCLIGAEVGVLIEVPGGLLDAAGVARELDG